MTKEPSETPTAAPEEPEERRGFRVGLPYYAWLAVTLPFIYVLSTGPVARAYKGKSAPDFVHVFYAPLGYAYLHNAPTKRAFDWYFKLWGAPQ
jgi:hypothetical protein